MKWLCIALLIASCAGPFGANELGYVIQTRDLKSAWKETESYRGIHDPWYGYWKSPFEFMADGGGDCEDYSTYMVYLLGPEASVCIIPSPFDKGLHAIVMYRGLYIEPQIYGVYYANPVVYWTFSYDWVMKHSTDGGSKACDGLDLQGA